MKKSLLFTGVAGLAAMFVMTGCASTPASLMEEVKKVEAVVAKARGLETHKKQADKYLIPNALLDQTRVLYISWAATATDSIKIRFGEADVIGVAKDANHADMVKAWDVLRTETDEAKIKEAAKYLEESVAQSYKKNKTTSKYTDKEIFEIVVGKMAQEDVIAKKTKKTDVDFSAKWLEIGNKNIKKVAAENKKMLAAAEKRLAAAEKDAEESKRKIVLTIQYYGSKVAVMVADGQLKNQTNPFVRKGIEIARNKAAQLMADAAKEFPGVTTVFAFPTTNNVEELKAAIEKELAPWKYALSIGGDRFSSFFEVRKWAREAQKTLDEASGN